VTDTTIYRLPPLPPTIRPLTTEQTRSLRERFPGLPTGPDQCITCKGRRTFRWYTPGVARSLESVVDYECPCEEQFILHRTLLNSGIKETYQRLGWADFERLPDSVATAVADYLEHFEAYVDAGFGLVLWGPKGTGKTLLAYLMVKELLAKGVGVYATTFAEMIDTFAGGWRDKDERAWFNRRVRDASALFIDDLGRERNKGLGSVGENMLEEVTRHRVGRSKPMFITTNPRPSEVEALYGGHVISLLHECSTTIEFTGNDWRLDRATDRLRFEVANRLTRPIVLG
jgi:DNA replication protein DnaC